MRRSIVFYKIICAAISSVMIAALLAGCGKDDVSAPTPEIAASENVTSEESANVRSDTSVISKDDAATDIPDEQVDEKWIEVLKQNGTFYDAFYNYPKIMKEEEPNHPDNVKMPDGIIKENNDYYIPDMEVPETESVDMSEIVGRWIPVKSTYMDIDSDWSWAKEAGLDFHLDLNADGTSSCNMFGGEQTAPWNEKSIPINGQDCAYGMVGDNLVLHSDMGLGAEMVYTFERDGETSVPVQASEGAEEKLLGHKLDGAKVYRMASSPDDHFVVMVETDEEYHSGYGYMRDGATDTALYYQGDRGIVKLINENTADRSRGMGRTKYEMIDDGKVLRLWPASQSDANKYNEYELSDEDIAPISRLAVGPNPDRNFEVPNGTHEKAGFWRLDKIYGYTYAAEDPLMQTDFQAGIDDNIYGTDSRKYDADVWYVLREDGTGYMRVWNKYFEVVWDDDGQYYYDISGRHKMGTVVGELDYDGTFMRMFKDEINEVPEYPEELKDK